MDQQTIKYLCKLYKKERSLRKVSRITGFSPNTVDKYVSKKFKVQRKTIITKLKSNSNILIGLFIGLWAGDGSRYYDTGYIVKIHYHLRNSQLTKFIKKLIFDLFGKKTRLYYDGGNKVSIKIHSKFIYEFPEKYLLFGLNKTLTVGLKRSTHSDEFIDGFLVGLMLSDGCIKCRFCFTSISKDLTDAVFDILCARGFSPRLHVTDRTKYGWHDLRQVYLKVKENKIALEFLDVVLKKAGWEKGFEILKKA